MCLYHGGNRACLFKSCYLQRLGQWLTRRRCLIIHTYIHPYICAYIHTWDNGWWPCLVLLRLPLRIDSPDLEFQPSLQNPATTTRAARCWASQSSVYFEFSIAAPHPPPGIHLAIPQVLLIGLQRDKIVLCPWMHAWLSKPQLFLHCVPPHLTSLADLKAVPLPSPSCLNLLYVIDYTSLSPKTWVQNQVPKGSGNSAMPLEALIAHL